MGYLRYIVTFLGLILLGMGPELGSFARRLHGANSPPDAAALSKPAMIETPLPEPIAAPPIVVSEPVASAPVAVQRTSGTRAKAEATRKREARKVARAKRAREERRRRERERRERLYEEETWPRWEYQETPTGFRIVLRLF